MYISVRLFYNTSGFIIDYIMISKRYIQGDSHAKKRSKRSDRRISHETDLKFCDSNAFWIPLSAVLQHGGYHHCRQMLGVSALAAVGSTGSINFMIIGFCTGACSGFAIPVAQKFGAGDYDGMRKFVANAGWLSAVFAAVMTTIVGFLCMRILQLDEHTGRHHSWRL